MRKRLHYIDGLKGFLTVCTVSYHYYLFFCSKDASLVPIPITTLFVSCLHGLSFVHRISVLGFLCYTICLPYIIYGYFGSDWDFPRERGCFGGFRSHTHKGQYITRKKISIRGWIPTTISAISGCYYCNNNIWNLW